MKRPTANSKGRPASKTPARIASFEKKPASGGIPAIASDAIRKVR